MDLLTIRVIFALKSTVVSEPNIDPNIKTYAENIVPTTSTWNKYLIFLLLKAEFNVQLHSISV